VVWVRPRFNVIPVFRGEAGSGVEVLARAAKRPETCACERIEPEWCKSTPEKRYISVADRNCVVARRGGEQRKAKDQSVG